MVPDVLVIDCTQTLWAKMQNLESTPSRRTFSSAEQHPTTAHVGRGSHLPLVTPKQRLELFHNRVERCEVRLILLPTHLATQRRSTYLARSCAHVACALADITPTNPRTTNACECVYCFNCAKDVVLRFLVLNTSTIIARKGNPATQSHSNSHCSDNDAVCVSLLTEATSVDKPNLQITAHRRHTSSLCASSALTPLRRRLWVAYMTAKIPLANNNSAPSQMIA